jgi:hypothetical protein
VASKSERRGTGVDMANLSNTVAMVNQKNPDSGIPSRVTHSRTWY